MEVHLAELAIKFLPYTIALLLTLLVAIFIFSIQLWRYGPDIRKLNKFETIAQLAYFSDKQKEMTAAFGAATAASNNMREAVTKAAQELENLREYVTDMQEKITEYHAEAIIKDRLQDAEEEARQRRKPGVLWSRSSGSRATTDDPDALYDSMMTQWDKFLHAFRQRLVEANITPVMNRIGKMTYQLTDKRRRAPIPLETAELITALHSQYRRYTRMQGTRGQWMNREIHDAFVRLVETAIQELNRPIGPADPPASDIQASSDPSPRLMQ